MEAPSPGDREGPERLRLDFPVEGAPKSASLLTQALAVNKRAEGEGWPDPGAGMLPQPLRQPLAVMLAPTVLYLKAHFFLSVTTFFF